MTSITLCAIMKNESRYILEWISFHRAIGVDKFVIYDNKSTDGAYDTLVALDRAGIIKCYSQASDGSGSPQVKAYNHCLRNHGADTELMGFIDADEFLVPLSHIDLKQWLTATFAANADMTAMAVNWKIYGSSGRIHAGDGLVMERFRKAELGVNRVFKSIVRPAAVREMAIHFAFLKDGRYGDEIGLPVEFLPEPGGVPGRISEPSASRLRVNHYMIKSAEEYAIKRNRGNANYTLDHPEKFKRFDDEYFRQADRNDVIDDAALQFLDATRTGIKELQELIKNVASHT